MTSRVMAATLAKRQDFPVAIRGVNETALSSDLTELAAVISAAKTSYGAAASEIAPEMEQYWNDVRFALLTGKITPHDGAQKLEAAAQAIREKAANPDHVTVRHVWKPVILLGLLAAAIVAWLIGTMRRVRAGAEPRVRAGAEPRVRAGAEPRVRAGAKPRVRAGAEPRVRAGAEPRVRAGAEPRVRAGAEPRVRAGAEPRVRAGAEPRVRASPGLRAGVQPWKTILAFGNVQFRLKHDNQASHHPFISSSLHLPLLRALCAFVSSWPSSSYLSVIVSCPGSATRAPPPHRSTPAVPASRGCSTCSCRTTRPRARDDRRPE